MSLTFARCPVALSVLAVLATTLSCARGSTPCAGENGCPRREECLGMRCVPEGTTPVAEGTQRVVAVPTAIAFASEIEQAAAAASVTLGRPRAALYLRFDPVWRRGSVHAAFLVLDPSRYGPAGADVELEVGRAGRAWTGAGFGAAQQPGVIAPFARGIARARPPLPVRIDVTELVHFAAEHAKDDHGFAVRAVEESDPGVTIATGLDGGKPPELDVYISGN